MAVEAMAAMAVEGCLVVVKVEELMEGALVDKAAMVVGAEVVESAMAGMTGAGVLVVGP